MKRDEQDGEERIRENKEGMESQDLPPRALSLAPSLSLSLSLSLTVAPSSPPPPPPLARPTPDPAVGTPPPPPTRGPWAVRLLTAQRPTTGLSAEHRWYPVGPRLADMRKISTAFFLSLAQPLCRDCAVAATAS